MAVRDEIIEALRAEGLRVVVWPPDPIHVQDPRAPLSDVDLESLAAKAKAAGLHPWRLEIGENFSFEHWQVASFGQLDDGRECFVTTDHVRASEHCSGPEEDATFAAAADPLTVAKMAIELLTLRRMVGRGSNP